MNFKIILLIFMNFSWVSFSEDRQVSYTLPVSSAENAFVSLDQNCSFVAKILQENDITKCASEFQDSSHHEINQESVFQFACDLVQRILFFLCKNNITLTNKDIMLDDKTQICPFNFIQISDLLGLSGHLLAKELTEKDHCRIVCYDLYKPKHQCVVLRKVIEYLSNVVSQRVQEIAKETEPPVSQTQKETKKIVGEKPKHESQLVSLKTDNSTKQVKLTESGTSRVEPSKPQLQNSSAVNVKTTKLTEAIPAVTESEKLDSSSKPYNKMTSPDSIKMKNEEYDIDENSELETDDINPLADIQRTNDNTENKEVPIEESVSKNEIFSGEGFFQAEESHFFFYFLMLSSVIVIGYLAFHNKNKILAYALEGSSGRRSRRRPNPARYRKLESNLEEAISSNTTQAAASSVVY